MYGAILGDMIGAPYEFDRGSKTKDFPLFCGCSQFTDDSVMTIAVAEALLDCRFRGDDDIRAGLVGSMRKWGGKYPDAGYGGRFRRWLRAKDPEPYGSCGNGSAMRVSSAGWLFDTPEETRRMARLRGYQGRGSHGKRHLPRAYRPQQGQYPRLCRAGVRI